MARRASTPVRSVLVKPKPKSWYSLIACQSPEPRACRSIDRLQFLPWLETDSFSGRNRNLRARPGIASNPGLAWPHIEHAEAAQFNAIALGQRLLHAFKHGFDRQLSFRLSDASLVHHFVDDVEFDHGRLPRRFCGTPPSA